MTTEEITHPPIAQRVTVNLTKKSVEAMDEIVALTDGTKTDAINKALQVYAMIQQAQSQGGGVWMQERAGEKSVLTRFR